MTLSQDSALPNARGVQAGSAGLPALQAVEAARYALLRRLAPCLRHQMVRPLQPIGLIFGVMHRKLAAVQPDLQSIRQEAEKINDFAKAAIDESMNMGTWLSPEPGVLATLEAGVMECVGLAATMLHFGGFRLVNEVEAMPVMVLRDAVRTVFSAALFALTDALTEPAALVICATAETADTSGDAGVTLSVRTAPSGEGRVDRYDDGYRPLTWDDVQALASAAQVGLVRQGDLVTMRFAAARQDSA